MKPSLLTMFAMLLSVVCDAQGSTTRLDSMAGSLIRNIQAQNKSKIWLVTDRDLYAAGETIYCKAWVVDSIRNRIQKKPKRLYVDLVNDSDKTVQQILLNNDKLQTNGSLILGDWLPEGNYWVRAYTANTNHNGEKPMMIVVPVYIVNVQQPHTTAKATVTDTAARQTITTPSVGLYPEGGAIVLGLPSTIAIKATDNKGKPLITSVTLTNKDSAVAKLVTNSAGLGKISYFPKWFYKYNLHVQNINGKDSVLPLPPYDYFAARLSVEQRTNDYLVARIALEDSINSRNYNTYLLAVSNDSLCFASWGSGMYDVTIPLTNFPGGKARLLLFNEQKKLLSERDVYIQKTNGNIDISTNKSRYAARENVQMTIRVTDAKGEPVLSSLAVSVVDGRLFDSSTTELNKDTLLSQPPEDVDLAMLTQQQASSNPIQPSVPAWVEDTNAEDSFVVSGKVMNKKGLPISKQAITLFSGKDNFVLLIDTIKANGSFRFVLPDFTDGTAFSFQVNSKRGRKVDDVQIVFDTVQQLHVSTPLDCKTTTLSQSALQSIRRRAFNADSFFVGTGAGYLKPVIVKTYKKKAEKFDASKRLSNFSHIITQDMIGDGAGRAGDMLLMMPGVHLSNGLVMIGGPSSFTPSAGNEPLVVIDGVAAYLESDSLTTSPVLNFLNSLSMRTIDFIEVLTGADAAIYGVRGGNGVISINTKSGGAANNTFTALQSYYPKGFAATKPFAMPDYNNPILLKQKNNDARLTIYWNGNLITDKEGKTDVQFFCADAATTYVATVTAVTAHGNVLQKRFQINRR